jgi:RNA polymerase sigma factor (sigma-70 family)
MNNPFREVMTEDHEEMVLITKSLKGDLLALEALVLRHQAWIYNIAIRMVFDPLAAEDITQEILIKIITKLSSFDPQKSAFRTWVYRIVVNHIINAKKSKKEGLVSSPQRNMYFKEYASQIQEPIRYHHSDSDIITKETKITCTQCILLSLNRRERMVFVLGVIFGVGHGVGGEICGVSRDNFRKILSRGRNKVFHFFQKKCSLINEDNPCRCEYHVQPMLKLKLIDPEDLLVERESHGTVRDIILGTLRVIEESHDEYVSLFRDQPFLKSPDMIRWLRDLVERKEIKAIMQIP